MGVVAGVIRKPHVVALVIDETRLPIPLIQFGIVDRDHVFELVTDLTDALDRRHFVAVGQAVRIQERPLVEPGRFHHQRVAVPAADRMAAVFCRGGRGLSMTITRT